MMLEREQMTKCFLCSAKEHDFFLIADRGGVSKFLTRGRTKADLCFRGKTKTKIQKSITTNKPLAAG